MISIGGFAFPPEVIVLAIPCTSGLNLSVRDVEELLVEHGVRG